MASSDQRCRSPAVAVYRCCNGCVDTRGGAESAMPTSKHASGDKRSSTTARAPVTSTHSAHGDGDHHDELASLQRSVGNAALAALVQAKLRVGAVDDPLEHEADRVASKVVARIERHEAGSGEGAGATDAHGHDTDAHGHGTDAHSSAPETSATPTVRRRPTADSGTAAGGELDAGTDA